MADLRGGGDLTFWQLLERAAEAAPDRLVVADDHGRSLTSEQLRRAAEAAAAGLGVRPGQVVSWQLPTVLEGVVVLAALARVGAVQNPIIPILREREVGTITAEVGTELLVVPERWRGFEHAAMGRDLGLEVAALDLEGDVGGQLRLPLGDPTSLPPPPQDPREVRWVYYSSGTTAAPKGARHTDASTIASSTGMVEGLGFVDGERYPIAWPVTHIGGITMLSAALRAGGALVLFDSFDPATTPERMAAHRPTILGSAVPFFRAYLDAQRRQPDRPLFPDLRVLTAGGAPTPGELVHELVDGLGASGIVQSYGLTEFPIATCVGTDDPLPAQIQTVGRPTEGVEVRLVDGEVRLRGPQCFAGYVDTALDAGAFDDEGWFRTGDLGELDDAGFLRITGRLKDVIIRNAENISAVEVEDALRGHPAIADITVVGVPDARTGERVVAVVVLEPGAELGVADLGEHCRARGLARQKVPEQLEVVDALPRNPMGKVLKQELVARLRG